MKINEINGKQATLKGAFAAGGLAIAAGLSCGASPSALAADAIADTPPAIGQKMPDGTHYAGIAPDTNKPFYTTPEDETAVPSTGPLNHNWVTYNWEAGKARCEFRGKGWGLPTAAQLNHLYNHRAAIGGFDVSGSFPTGYYWSSTKYKYGGWFAQRFSDSLGIQSIGPKDFGLSVRCVLN